MLFPHLSYIVIRLKPSEFTALDSSVNTGITFREDDFVLAIPINIANSDFSRDIPLGKLMGHPTVIGVLIPVGSTNQLIFSVAINVSNRKSFFWL